MKGKKRVCRVMGGRGSWGVGCRVHAGIRFGIRQAGISRMRQALTANVKDGSP